MIGRIVIDDVRPSTPAGYPAKAVVGEQVEVSADIFRDGHDLLDARARLGDGGPTARLHHQGNDRWAGVLVPSAMGLHQLVVEAWTDSWATWRHKAVVKLEAGQDVEVELEEAARLVEARGLDELAAVARDTARTAAERVAALTTAEVAARCQGPDRAEAVTTSRPHPLRVERERALAGAWYELFPRSEGGLVGTAKRLDAVAAMGFDVLYLPPIHPIGRSFRKGRNGTLEAGADDPGSPWAIGAEEGGHTAVHPELGTLADFDDLVARASELGMEVALDYALQCSPEHPWVQAHPEWFHHRPDGSIAYAENPPKKYQDIYPIDFWPAAEADRVALWEACKGILDFWISHGVRIFRVDNPHTKPMAFWEWVIPAVLDEHPDVILLAEAFTRPKVMAKLAEVGFTQSYTYFTWRTDRWGLTDYVTELAHSPKADYVRPNFWPNTPDILLEPLRRGPLAAFRQRLVLAATLVPSYGIYAGYELGENEPASELNEEYLNSEKYEVKRRDWDAPHSLAPFVTNLNAIRRRHPALRRLRNVRFHGADNDQVIVYSKRLPDETADVAGDGLEEDVVLVVVNLDPHHPQECTLSLDLGALGLSPDQPFEAHDELTGQSFPWRGPHPYVRLDPTVEPAHLLHLRS